MNPVPTMSRVRVGAGPGGVVGEQLAFEGLEGRAEVVGE
jgi:hypothetical protein